MVRHTTARHAHLTDTLCPASWSLGRNPFDTNGRDYRPAPSFCLCVSPHCLGLSGHRAAVWMPRHERRGLVSHRSTSQALPDLSQHLRKALLLFVPTRHEPQTRCHGACARTSPPCLASSPHLTGSSCCCSVCQAALTHDPPQLDARGAHEQHDDELAIVDATAWTITPLPSPAYDLSLPSHHSIATALHIPRNHKTLATHGVVPL
jgi:hypothetical protein